MYFFPHKTFANSLDKIVVLNRLSKSSISFIYFALVADPHASVIFIVKLYEGDNALNNFSQFFFI